MKHSRQILKYIAVIIINLIMIGIGQHLIDSKIIELKWDWLIYPYYFGIGMLAWYPYNYILNYHKKN